MKKLFIAGVALLALGAAPAVSTAQSTGSFGSLGAATAPATPAEHDPNPHELATIDELNEIIVETFEMLADESGDSDQGNPWAVDGELGDPPVLERDSELSRLAQYGADKLAPRFPEAAVNVYNELTPNLVARESGYLEMAVCGPAPVTVDNVGEALRDSYGYAGSIGELSYSGSYPLFAFEEPLIGIGYAEHGGNACSYALVRSANYPFR